MKKTMLALAVAVLTTSALGGTFTSEDILKVEPGMGVAEVEARLGKPRLFGSGSTDGGVTVDWLYVDTDTKRKVYVTYSTPSQAKRSTWKVTKVSAWEACVLEAFAKAAKDGKIKIGATREQVQTALGAAYRHIKINQTLTQTVTHEQWVIGEGQYLYFEKGILTSLQTSAR